MGAAEGGGVVSSPPRRYNGFPGAPSFWFPAGAERIKKNNLNTQPQ
jgi:hypothetical protein